jgi:hypothetical protein
MYVSPKIQDARLNQILDPSDFNNREPHCPP